MKRKTPEMPVYTLGHQQSYREYLETAKYPRKLGPRPDINGEPYKGGIAFQTAWSAREWAKKNNKNWVPFLLDGDWPDDVWWDEDSNFHRIKRDLLLIREVE